MYQLQLRLGRRAFACFGSSLPDLAFLFKRREEVGVNMEIGRGDNGEVCTVEVDHGSCKVIRRNETDNQLKQIS